MRISHIITLTMICVMGIIIATSFYFLKEREITFNMKRICAEEVRKEDARQEAKKIPGDHFLVGKYKYDRNSNSCLYSYIFIYEIGKKANVQHSIKDMFSGKTIFQNTIDEATDENEENKLRAEFSKKVKEIFGEDYPKR